MGETGNARTGPRPAPRGRRALAGTVDFALVGLPLALVRMRALRARSAPGPAGRGGRQRGAGDRALQAAYLLFEQQIRSPGQWLAGLRTVDRRTGRRVALGRSLALALATAGVQGLRDVRTRRRAPALEARRERWDQAMREIRERHPRDSPERAEAMRRLHEQQRPAGVEWWRVLIETGAHALVAHQLRRRLAPTVLVDVRAHADGDGEGA